MAVFMRDSSTLSQPVARFADALLSHDLPALDAEPRRQTVASIEKRVAVLPSVTRFGVRLIGAAVDVLMRLVGSGRTIGVVTWKPIPLLSEYPRLVRSLGYAFIWETWTTTRVDGGAS